MRPQQRLKFLVEPGVMPVFRLFVTIMLTLATLMICRGLTPPRRDLILFLFWLTYGSLFLYLRWERLQSWLGAAYLPIGIGIATLGPIFAEGLPPILRLYIWNQDPASIASGAERMLLWLIVPFLVLTTQYNLVVMLLYTLFITVAPFLLALPAYPIENYVNDSGEQAIARMVIYGLVGFVIVRLTAGEREQRQALAEKNSQLTDFAATLEELAITQERNRLARELHDTLAHTLSAVNIQLKALEALWESDPAAAKSRLTDMQNLTRNGLNDARRALQQLRARPIEELGLALAMRRLVQQAAERGGFAYQISIPPEFSDLSDSIEQQVYRIAEEGLNNIVRHAQASKVVLLLEKEGNHLRLMLKDNGIGFDSGDQSNGRFGLVGMHERAELIGGELSIESETGGGTTISMRAPLRRSGMP